MKLPFRPHSLGTLKALAATCAAFSCTAPERLSAQVVINEIHYHPVENPSFDAAGNPVLDINEDVHEFVEIHNAGTAPVDLSGWQLSGGVAFTAPLGTAIAAGGYKVIGKNPARLQTVYGIAGVLGPFTGTLSNRSDTLKWKNAANTVVDSVSYVTSFPWPGSADALGADAAFTLISNTPSQYKGRSLERYSLASGSNDPANWLASPLASGPTPGAANNSTGAAPKPVIISYSVTQLADDSPVIRAAQQVRIQFLFSGTATPGGVDVEYWLDDINSLTEARTTVPATALGNGNYSATLPGQVDRSVVRWRIRADRGGGVEPVAPRADDPAVVPTGLTTREAWFAYFVQPVRTAVNPVYDCFVSSADATSAAFNGRNGLAAMNYNIIGNPKRVTSAALTGLPRAVPHVPPTAQLWNGTVPCIHIENGVVRDALLRYHGSRYNRSAGRQSYKLQFADHQKFRGSDSVFITDKGDYFSVMHGLFINANLPMSEVRWVDWYLNANGRQFRLEQGEYNGDLLDPYHERIKDMTPGSVKEATGEFYKSVGTIDIPGEGPYGRGDERRLPAAGAWTSLQRFDWTYALQNHGWKGPKPFKDFVDGLWTARGDTETAINANVSNTRAYMLANYDMDLGLTALAVCNWGCPWDDTTQNHFVWRRASGKWVFIPWDFDAFFGNGDTTGTNSWIYLGQTGSPPAGILGNNFRGPNFLKDSVFRGLKAEYDERMWLLNNTYLHPDNLKTLFFRNNAGNQVSYYTQINAFRAGFCEARFASANTQTGHLANGSDFARPAKPVHVSPATNTAAIPAAELVASDYTHTSGSTTGSAAHTKTKWEMRRSDKTYAQPVWVLTSTADLTHTAIPFADLEFTQTYFWRVTYYDALDHPSFISTETSFVFGPAPGNVTVINWNDPWKYDATSAYDDATWTQPAFVDSGWPSATGALAFETNAISGPAVINNVLPDPRGAAGRSTIYFRRKFIFPGNPATSTVRLRHLIDDGCVIYLNGTRIHRYRMPDTATYAYATVATSTALDGVYLYADAAGTPDTSWIDPRPLLVEGENTIAVEVHQNPFVGPGSPTNSSDVTFGLSLEATVVTTGGTVALNEIMADNRNAVTNGSSNPDYVELRNNTAAAINLNGWSLSDDTLVPGKYLFPGAASIPAGGRLVVWCDSNAAEPGLHAGFKLASSGQTVAVFEGSNVRDFIIFGPQAANFAIGRAPDGVGSWSLMTPSAGAVNTAALPIGSSATLKFNEWMANPASGEDWFELHNPDANPVALAGLFLSDAPGVNLTQIPALSFIAGNGFTRFEADGSSAGGNHSNFKLGTAGDSLSLIATNGITTLNSVSFGAQTRGASEGRFPDGSASIVPFPQSVSPGESNWLPAPIVIHEALTNSTAPLEDSIELHNPTAIAVNASGWWLSDDRTHTRKFQLPAGSTIAPGGYLVFIESQFNTGANPFSLGSTGDELVLSAIDGANALTGYRSQVTFGAAADGVSFGRVLTGNPPGSNLPEFWPLLAPTFGNANAAPRTGPLIINEVMYHPTDFAGPPVADNARDEFVELHNITTSPQNIGGWRLKNAADFVFHAGTVILPGDYGLVVSFDPATDTASLDAFRATYNLATSIAIYGPLSSKLPNDTAAIELAYPGPLTGGATPFILVDKIDYLDSAPWPSNADGGGPSLQRLSRVAIGNDSANWLAAVATPGTVNSGQTPIIDSDGDGLPDAWETTNGLNRFDALDAMQDRDGDGQSNQAEYVAGTDPRDPASALLATVTTVTSGFRLSFPVIGGRSYSVKYRESPGTGTWQNLPGAGNLLPPGNQILNVTDTTAATRRFYRILTPAQP